MTPTTQTRTPSRCPSVVRLAGLCAAATLFAAGCAGSTASRGVSVEGPRVAPPAGGGGGAAAQPEDAAAKINARAKLLFEDAMKATDQQRKTGKMDYASLEKKFEAASAADSGFAEPEYNLGVLAERQGQPQRAVEHYKEALRRKPTLHQAAENLAVIAQNGGDEEGAVRIYRDILENYPDDAGSRARLAEIYRRRGELDKAVEMAREALFRDPKTLTAYKVMMLVYYEQKQFAMAKLVALRAMKLDENDPEIYHTLGLVLLAEKEPAKARVQFKKAVAARPDFLPSHRILAKMALEQEDYSGAEESIRRLLQAEGKSAEAHVNLGVAYKGMGQLDKAMGEYDTAQKLNPNLPSIYLNRGIIVAQKGDPNRALELYRQYINLSGGEVAVPADHPVHQLVRDAEQTIQQREADKRALEEAKRMEEEAKRNADAAAAEDKKKKEEELKKSQEEAKGKGAAKPAAKEAAPPPAEKKPAPPPPPAKKPESGSKPPPKSAEPGDEPSDGL